MVDYTTPVTTTFEMQRQSIEQGQRALTQSVEFQKQMTSAMLDSMESTESAQRRTVELLQEGIHNTLDVIEANVPGADVGTEDMRAAVDEQFEMLLENHAEAFDALTEEVDEGVASYDEMTGDYLAAVEDQLELLLDAHEELEVQSVEAVEQLAEQVEEMQDQMEEMQAQMRDVSEQTVEAVEA